MTHPGLCLDTSVCIDLMRNRRSLADQAFAAVPTSVLWISAVTLAELGHGVARAKDPLHERRRLQALLEQVAVRPFDARAAESAGTVGAQLAREGRTIGALDTLIGAHALAEGALLMTGNVREFSRIPGLAIAQR